jgi:hypothetical protein
MKRTKLSLLVNYSLLPVTAARRSRFRRAAIAEQPYVQGQHYSREEGAKILPAHRIFTFTDPVQNYRYTDRFARPHLTRTAPEEVDCRMHTQRWKWAINLDRDVKLPSHSGLCALRVCDHEPETGEREKVEQEAGEVLSACLGHE